MRIHTLADLAMPGIPVWNRDFDRNASIIALRQLSRNLSIPVRSLRGATLQSYVGRVFATLPQRGFVPWLVPLGVYHRTRRRGLPYCPLCLRESPYYRLEWRLAFLTACRVHRVQLLDRCPACAATVNFHRNVAARQLITQCHQCGHLLDSGPAMPAGLAEWRAQEALFAIAFGSGVHPGPWPGLGRPDCLAVLRGLLGYLLGRHHNKRNEPWSADNGVHGQFPGIKSPFEALVIADRRRQLLGLATHAPWSLANVRSTLRRLDASPSVLQEHLGRYRKHLGLPVPTPKVGPRRRNPATHRRVSTEDRVRLVPILLKRWGLEDGVD
jgi:hypothetical protein